MSDILDKVKARKLHLKEHPDYKNINRQIRLEECFAPIYLKLHEAMASLHYVKKVHCEEFGTDIYFKPILEISDTGMRLLCKDTRLTVIHIRAVARGPGDRCHLVWNCPSHFHMPHTQAVLDEKAKIISEAQAEVIIVDMLARITK
jgi:hypothetical protein